MLIGRGSTINKIVQNDAVCIRDINEERETTMKQKTLKILLAIVSALLAGVLLVQVLYMSGVFKAKAQPEEPQSASADTLSGVPLHREALSLLWGFSTMRTGSVSQRRWKSG